MTAEYRENRRLELIQTNNRYPRREGDGSPIYGVGIFYILYLKNLYFMFD